MKIFIYLPAVLFFVATQVEALSVSRCKLDKNNACKDYSSASTCRTTNYCKVEIWNQPTTETKLCSTCLTSIKNLQKKTVEYDLSSLCGEMPVDFLNADNECRVLIKKNLDQIHQDIAENLEPQTICRALSFCHSDDSEEIDSDSYVKQLISKSLAAQWMPGPVLINKACDDETECKNYKTAKECNVLLECKSSTWSLPVKSDTMCQLCEDEIQKLQNMIKQDTTKEIIKKDLYGFCDKISLSVLRQECSDLVSEDFDLIYDDIIAYLEPARICRAMKLCQSISDEENVKLMMEKLPGILQKALDANRLPAATPIMQTAIEALPSLDLISEENSCSDCEAFVKDFQNTALNNKKIVNDWISMLKTECDALGEGIGALCQENVDRVISYVLMQHKSNADDSKVVCQKIMMCEAFSKKSVGDMCTDCKTFFTEWQEMLKANSSIVDNVVQAVSQFYCLQTPEKERDQCARYVAMVIKVLIKRMESEDVGQICSRLEFCDEKTPVKIPDLRKFARKISKIFVQSLPNQKHQVGGDHCTDCNNFITDLQNVIKNNQSLVQELVDLAKQECDELGELSEVCSLLINDHYQEILQQFIALDVDTICSAILMCGEKVKMVGGDICSDCTAFVDDWQDIITNNQSIIDKVTALAKEQICDLVPFILKGECDKVFDQISAKIIQSVKGTDAGEICSTLYFCDGKFEIEEKNVKALSDLECQECKFVIEEVEKLIEGNNTEAAIESALKEVCELYGEDIKADCKMFMEKYGPDVIDYLIAEMNALDICLKLGLCEKAMRFKLQKVKAEEVTGEVECEFCELLITEVDKLLKDNATEQEILDEISKVCQYLGKEDAECDTIVHEYGPALVLLLAQELSPTEVCNAIKLCSDSQLEKKKVITGIECEVCQLVAGELDSLLMKNSTAKEIEAALEEVCSIVPTVKDECDILIEQYGPQIIEILVAEMDPSKICVDIKLCTSSNKLKKVKLPIVCTLCEAFISYLDKSIDYNSTEEDILEALEEVCEVVPKREYVSCKNFVEKYASQIVDLILKVGTEPTVVCHSLGLCILAPQEITNLQSTKKIVKLNSDAECAVCKLIAQQLDDLLMKNSTEAEIEAALDKVCAILPGEYKDDCDALVHEYGPTIVDLLVEEMKPERICSDLGLCTNEKISEKKIEKLNSDTECTICKLIAQQLDDLLMKNSTEAEIEAALDKVCAILPGEYKDDCDALVHEYGPTIVDLLVEEMKPERICLDLSLCTDGKISEKKIVKLNSDTECAVCKLIAQQLDDLLIKNSTEAEIEAALDKVCALLPGDYKNDCDTIVHEYGPTIVELLVKELEPEAICSEIGLCTNGKISEKKIEKLNSDAECTICKLIAQQLDDLLMKNSTEAEIEAALDEVCALLPGEYKNDCDTLVHEYGSKIVSLLIQEMKPEIICSDIGLCGDGKILQKDIKINSETDCDICKLVAEELEKLLMKDSTQNEIEAALEQVCSILPSTYKTACDGLIEQYGPEIIQILIEEMNPSKICVTIKLCSSTKLIEKVSSEITCELCKTVAIALDDLLKEDSTEAEIKAALEEVCSILPENIKAECDNLITEYGDAIINLLVEQVSPDKICPEIGLCAKKMKTTKNDNKVNSETDCDICKLVAEELEKLLMENSTQNEIEAALEQVCSILPSTYKTVCDGLIEQYGPEIIQTLIEEMKPSKICVTIKLCSSTELIKKMSGVVECQICQVVMKELENMLDKKSTKAEILNAVNKVCEILPQEDRSICSEYIKDYGPGVIAILVDGFVPGKVCKILKLCQSNSIKETTIKLHVRSEKLCQDCKIVIQELDDILQNNYTEPAIEIALDLLCDKVPSTLESECLSLVKQYTPIILEYADKILNPSFICQKMELCPTDLQKSILGVDPCTYGPTFWCRDLDTAKRCNAVEHCMNHMWE